MTTDKIKQRLRELKEAREFWIDHDTWYSKEEKEFNDKHCTPEEWNPKCSLVKTIEANKWDETITALEHAVEALEYIKVDMKCGDHKYEKDIYDKANEALTKISQLIGLSINHGAWDGIE